MKMTPKVRHALEFKREAISLVTGWQSITTEIRTLDVPTKSARLMEPFIRRNSGRPYWHDNLSRADFVAFPPRGEL